MRKMNSEKILVWFKEIFTKDAKNPQRIPKNLFMNGENKLVLELKTVEGFTAVHFAQILTYLKLGNYPLGLLFNYNSTILRNNIKRFINTPSWYLVSPLWILAK